MIPLGLGLSPDAARAGTAERRRVRRSSCSSGRSSTAATSTRSSARCRRCSGACRTRGSRSSATTAPGRGSIPRAWPTSSASASHVTVASFVDDARLRALYAEASAFAFLSEYEGFGLTPLEALAAGVPPVVLDTAVAREVYGAAATYVAAPDAGLVADALVGHADRPRAAASGARRRARRARAVPLGRRRRGDAPCDRGRGPVTLTIVIVAFNAREDLERCLASLTAAPRRAARTRWSSSTTPRPTARRRWCARAFPHVRLLAAPGQRRLQRRQQPRRSGKAAASCVLLLNPDTVVPRRRDRYAGRRAAGAPGGGRDRAAAGRRRRSAPSCRSGRCRAPGARRGRGCLARRTRRRVWPMHAWVESMTRRDAHGRVGQRRVPARPPGRCGRGRAAGRAVLPVLGGRGLLRRAAGGRTDGPLHAGCRGDTPARPIGRRRRAADGDGGLPARPAGVLSEVAAGMGAAPGVVPAGARATSAIVGEAAGGD